MRALRDDIACYAAANGLRSTISQLFAAEPSQRIILGPGILVMLQILFANLRIRRVALTDEEYYSAEHFPGLAVETFSAGSFVRRIQNSKPDAVLVSAVTWCGRSLALRRLFGEIRTALGDEAPILIADYSHAGAAGFPPVTDLDADVVCGDPAKWVLDQNWIRRLAFFWFREDAFFEHCKKAFEPFFLATPEKGKQFSARWIEPQDVYAILGLVEKEGLDRGTLLKRYRNNLSLTSELAMILKIEPPPDSTIIWLDKDRDNHPIPSWLIESGLVWRPATGGTRICCRAEAMDRENAANTSTVGHRI